MLYTVCMYVCVFNTYTDRVICTIYNTLNTYTHSKGVLFLGDNEELRPTEKTAVMFPI